MKNEFKITVVQLILIAILLIMINGALDERSLNSERFDTLDQNLNELNARIEYNNLVLSKMENELKETQDRLLESETWLKEHEKFIEDNEADPCDAEIIFRKQRDGTLGIAKQYFAGKFFRFTNWQLEKK